MHYILTRQFFPRLKPREAHRINAVLDNRSNSFMQFSEFDVLGIARRGHRKKKHDAFSAAALGARIAGADGMQAAFFHTCLDKMDEQVREQYGAINRDILMACWKKTLLGVR